MSTAVKSWICVVFLKMYIQKVLFLIQNLMLILNLQRDFHSDAYFRRSIGRKKTNCLVRTQPAWWRYVEITKSMTSQGVFPHIFCHRPT